MKKILITGGAGYIGSVLVPKLLLNGYRVTVIDNFIFNQTSLLDCCKFENFNLVYGDCRNKKLMSTLCNEHDIIIPLAALVGAPICAKDPLGAESINQDAIYLLCELLDKSKKIIMPVSNSGYGIGERGKYCDENTPLNPISLYGITKVNAEKAVLERENSLTFRLATVFGVSPRMRTDLLVNDFTYRAVNDKAVIVFEGHFKRNYIHIQDVAEVFIFAIKNFDSMKGESYNVGLEDANLSKLELCKEIQKKLPNFVYLNAPIGEDPDKRDYIVSNKKILSKGFLPSWTISRGIDELIKGYSIIRKNQFSNI